MSAPACSNKSSTCALGCLPVVLSAEEAMRLDALARDKTCLKKGVMLFEQRHVKFIDVEGLRQLAGSAPSASRLRIDLALFGALGPLGRAPGQH